MNSSEIFPEMWAPKRNGARNCPHCLWEKCDCLVPTTELSSVAYKIINETKSYSRMECRHIFNFCYWNLNYVANKNLNTLKQISHRDELWDECLLEPHSSGQFLAELFFLPLE